MDIRVANYVSQTVSANPSPARAGSLQGSQAAKAAFQALLGGAQQTAAPAPQALAPAQEPQRVASNPDGRGTIIDILV